MLNTIIRNKANLTLLVILIVGAVVRFWGINFGLPGTECRPDETTIIQVVLGFFTGDLNPHFFNYPTLYMYIIFILYIGYYLLGLLVGQFSSISYFFATYSISPSAFYLINRCFTAFLGTATIFVTYAMVKHLFNKKTGLIASLFLSLAYLHVRDSHFGVTDVPTTFFIMCAMLFIIKSYKIKDLRNYMLAGIFTGLAISTKYTAILLVLPMLLVHLLHVFEQGEKNIALYFDKRILIFTGLFIVVFLLTTPFALFDFSAFMADISYEMNHFNRGHVMLLGKGWWYHLKFSLFFGLGWSLFFASLIGMIVLIKTDIKKFLVLCSFPLVYYALIGKGNTVFVRYTMPLIPFLCITGSFLIAYITEKFLKFSKNELNISVTSLMAILIIVPSVLNTVEFNQLLAKEDNRLTAKKWVERNLEEGSTIYQSGAWWGMVPLHPTTNSLEQTLGELNKMYETQYERRRELKAEIYFLKAQIEYFRKHDIRGYTAWGYDHRQNLFTYDNKKTTELPQYIILQESHLLSYSSISRTIIDLLKSFYHMKMSFKVIDVRDKKHLFDQQDCFYIPYVGFTKIIRPGPNIYIYEKKPKAR